MTFPPERHDFINAVSDALFTLMGGRYGVYFTGTFPKSASIVLQLHIFVALIVDTWVDVANGVFTAPLYTTLDLSPGQYRLHLLDGGKGPPTLVSASISRIPLGND